jgi:hypothetical protein
VNLTSLLAMMKMREPVEQSGTGISDLFTWDDIWRAREDGDLQRWHFPRHALLHALGQFAKRAGLDLVELRAPAGSDDGLSEAEHSGGIVHDGQFVRTCAGEQA